MENVGMFLLYYFAGVITGLIISVLVIIITLKIKTKVERTINQIESKLKPRGAILSPELEEVENWVNSLEQTDDSTK